MDDKELLGKLAADYRSACKHRTGSVFQIMDDYAAAVDRLIKSGTWKDYPAPEDQLPVDMMPRTFFDYWAVEKKKVADIQKQLQEKAQNIENAIGLIMWIIIIVGMFWIMSQCGGCFNDATRLFWH